MQHPFIPSQIDSNKCASCRYEAQDHTDRATCEACGNTGTCEISGPFNHPQSMLLCMDCQAKEKAAVAEYQSAHKQEERAKNHNNSLLQHTKELLGRVKSKNDLFNIDMIPIVDIFGEIDQDTGTQNKLYKKCETLQGIIKQFQDVIFDLRYELKRTNEGQAEFQKKLNEMANGLRQDERERLKLNDINYKPGAIKSVKTTIKKPKPFDKQALRNASAKYKIPAELLQMYCKSRNLEPEQAALQFLENAKQMKAGMK